MGCYRCSSLKQKMKHCVCHSFPSNPVYTFIKIINFVSLINFNSVSASSSPLSQPYSKLIICLSLVSRKATLFVLFSQKLFFYCVWSVYSYALALWESPHPRFKPSELVSSNPPFSPLHCISFKTMIMICYFGRFFSITTINISFPYCIFIVLLQIRGTVSSTSLWVWAALWLDLINWMPHATEVTLCWFQA